MDVDNVYQVGWVCHKCGRVLAPWMSECPCYYINIPLSNVSDLPVVQGVIISNKIPALEY